MPVDQDGAAGLKSFQREELDTSPIWVGSRASSHRLHMTGEAPEYRRGFGGGRGADAKRYTSPTRSDGITTAVSSRFAIVRDRMGHGTISHIQLTPGSSTDIRTGQTKDAVARA